jgi:hypothetical protein
MRTNEKSKRGSQTSTNFAMRAAQKKFSSECKTPTMRHAGWKDGIPGFCLVKRSCIGPGKKQSARNSLNGTAKAKSYLNGSAVLPKQKQ